MVGVTEDSLFLGTAVLSQNPVCDLESHGVGRVSLLLSVTSACWNLVSETHSDLMLFPGTLQFSPPSP